MKVGDEFHGVLYVGETADPANELTGTVIAVNDAKQFVTVEYKIDDRSVRESYFYGMKENRTHA